MPIIRFAVDNPVKVTVGVVLAALFGLLAFYRTPVQLTPDVAEPEIEVSTMWPGASAAEVEREIVDEQEEQLKSVEGLSEFKSESRDSQATITLKFPVGFDLVDARMRVSDKLNQVPEYPQDAREPTISEGSQNSEFIAWVILKPLPPSRDEVASFAELHPQLRDVLDPFASGERVAELPTLLRLSRDHPELAELMEGRADPTLMRKFAEDVIEARLERVPGVSNSNVIGGREQECHVVIDPPRLAAHQLTTNDLRIALAEQNKNTSAGDIWEGKQRNVVRTLGQFDSVEEVSETIIALRDNAPVRVRDVATVRIDYHKPDGMVRQKGVFSLAINCQQSPGTNVLEIMGPTRDELDLDGDGNLTQIELAECKKIHGDCIRIAIEELNLGTLQQRGLTLEQVYDQTEYIHSATALVSQNIYVGGALAVMVLLVFLRSPRSVLIVGLSIPISIIASFLFIRGFGRSINVISLAGMAFAVGMVVDNAIVVLENVYRHYQLGESPGLAAVRGTTEVWGAVLASTLTTLAVFVPVIFVEGQAGQLFRDIAIAIACAVAISLVVSVTVIPSAAKRILKPHAAPGPAGYQARQQPTMPGFAARLVNLFAGGMDRLLSMPGNTPARIAIILLFVSGSLLGAWALTPETEYLPEGNRNLVFAILLPPPGYNLEQMAEIGQRVEADLAPHWEAEPGSPEEAALDGPRIENFFFVARGGRLFMGARSEDPLRAAELVPVLQRATYEIPGMIAIVSQSSLFQSGLSGGRAIDIEISGPEMEKLNGLGSQVFAQCMGIGPYEGQALFPPLEGHQTTPRSNLESTSPELHVVPRWEKAADLGVTADDLGYAVNALVDGAYAGDYWHQGRKIDLVIYGAEDYARRTQDLSQLPIATPAGMVVNVGDVATLNPTGGPEVINHIERQRAVTIQVKPATWLPLETAMQRIEDQIRQPLLASPAAEGGLYQIRLAGTSDKLVDTRRQMQGSLLLAAIITYLLMAALFESFFFPIVIMTSVALALVGGFGGLRVLNLFTEQSLDMLTMLGFVILIGTVVNNAILIVHQSLNNIREGMSDRSAIVDSVRTRVRPIFMSTLTTVLGMLPLVVPLPGFAPNGGLRLVAGAGSELYRGLGSVVLGGLLVSTLFTLILVPVGFSLALDARRALGRMFSLPAVGAETGTQPQQAPGEHAASSVSVHESEPVA